jgi:hypothetical protein
MVYTETATFQLHTPFVDGKTEVSRGRFCYTLGMIQVYQSFGRLSRGKSNFSKIWIFCIILTSFFIQMAQSKSRKRRGELCFGIFFTNCA